MQITGTRAAITGGASGLGLATARALLANRGRVALLDLNARAGAAVATQESSSSRSTLFLRR